jgi:hypothetical protein
VVELPETQYVETPEGAYLAYQTFGRGSLDLLVPMKEGSLSSWRGRSQ